ncbi:hypothetical protein OIDMADRAFT_29435 [Oidiodendron maius Zn]|uniref:Uncharacterized protein n=1 Tax=Oidiodendron maius (strain Zn) TaxID=913774 RepID=A0A0C3CMU0_OIDMZ|nr:hypothetical protein OIDMADRAFT_29435 [Oidiodendron maius Zn]
MIVAQQSTRATATRRDKYARRGVWGHSGIFMGSSLAVLSGGRPLPYPDAATHLPLPLEISNGPSHVDCLQAQHPMDLNFLTFSYKRKLTEGHVRANLRTTFEPDPAAILPEQCRSIVGEPWTGPRSLVELVLPDTSDSTSPSQQYSARKHQATCNSPPCLGDDQRPHRTDALAIPLAETQISGSHDVCGLPVAQIM